MNDVQPRLRFSYTKLFLVLVATALAVLGGRLLLNERCLLGLLIGYTGFLIVFFCGAHGLSASRSLATSNGHYDDGGRA